MSGAKRIERAMRPTCALAVVHDLETHCAGMTRVSMRPVADFFPGRHEARRIRENLYAIIVWA